MGLLDVFLNGTGDPQKDAAINRGLLQAGLALMQSRGKLFPALGQAGMAGLQASDQVRQQQQQQQRAGLQDQMLQYQLGQQKREADMAALPGQFYKPPTAETVDATGGMDTQAQPATPGGFDMEGYLNAVQAKAGPVVAAQQRAALQKAQPAMVTFKPGEIGGTFENGKFNQVFAAPDKANEDPFVRLLKQAGIDPMSPQGQEMMKARIGKETSHPLPTSVKIDNKIGEGVAKEIGPMVKESYDAARGAQQQVVTSDSLIRAVDSGKVFTGPTATLRLKGAQLGQMLGIGGSDTTEIISNTRAAIQGLAQSTVAARGALKGQGQVSDFEGRLLERAASGNVDDLTAGEIKQIAMVNKRLATQQLKNHTQMVEKLKSRPNTADMANMFELPLQDQTQPGGTDLGGGFRLK